MSQSRWRFPASDQLEVIEQRPGAMVQVQVVGESTGRDWNDQSIPNLNIDTNQFVKKQRIGGYEHLRFNNAQVGSIFRERLTAERADGLFQYLPYSIDISPGPGLVHEHAAAGRQHPGAWLPVRRELLGRYHRDLRNPDRRVRRDETARHPQGGL